MSLGVKARQSERIGALRAEEADLGIHFREGSLDERVSPADRGGRLRRVLLFSDLTAIGTATAVTSLLLAANSGLISKPLQILTILACVPVFLVLAQLSGLYHLSERHIDHTLAEELGPLFTAITVWSWIVALTSSVVAGASLQLIWFAVFWAVALAALVLGRTLVRRLTQRVSWYRQSVILIGDPSGIDRVLRRIRRHPECGIDPIGSIRRIPSGNLRASSFDDAGHRENIEILGDSPAHIVELVRQAEVQRVVLCGWSETLEERTELIRQLASSGIFVDIVSGEPEALCSDASIHHMEGLPIMTVRPPRMTRTGRGVKRALDIGAASAGLLVLSPLLVYVAVRIKLDSKGPVFFRQDRAGLDGRTFQMLKFRTMVADAEERKAEVQRASGGNLFKLRDDPRITDFGAKIRRSSVDELPQLWNVLRGDMSLVGPRPLPLDEAPMAADHFADRARVRPGMTGPWQIHGRSDIPFEDMVKLDYTYASTWSLQEDLRLLIRTVGAVAASRGAY